MPTPVPPPMAPNSGIKTSSSGDRHIPQSVRADGSLRKEIKIRPGYRPPEDVEIYKNRTAETWKTRGSGGIPGADGIKDAQDTGEGVKGKNAKRREARKKAKAADGDEGVNGVDVGGASLKHGRQSKAALDSEPSNTLVEPAIKADKLTPAAAPEAEGQQQITAEADEKQARNLKKKLRQARELKDKKESGESLLPEQFAKVIKIQELIRQLDALGFDGDGNKKAEDTP